MVFLQDHGYEFAIEDDLTMYRAMIAVSEKSLDKYGLAELLDELVTK